MFGIVALYEPTVPTAPDVAVPAADITAPSMSIPQIDTLPCGPSQEQSNWGNTANYFNEVGDTFGDVTNNFNEFIENEYNEFIENTYNEFIENTYNTFVDEYYNNFVENYYNNFVNEFNLYVSGGGGTGDHKVMVTSNDTVPKYLAGKLTDTRSTGFRLDELNDGGDEEYNGEINFTNVGNYSVGVDQYFGHVRSVATPVMMDAGMVLVDGADTTLGYLYAKLSEGLGTTLTVDDIAGDEFITIDSNKVSVTSADDTADYLDDKLDAATPMVWNLINSGGDESYEVEFDKTAVSGYTGSGIILLGLQDGDWQWFQTDECP